MSKPQEDSMTPQDHQDAVDRAVAEMVRNRPAILGGIPDNGEPAESTPNTDEQKESKQ